MLDPTKIPGELLRAVSENNVVPVVGPGVTRETRTGKDTFFRTWKALFESAAQELEKQTGSKEAIGVRAQLAQDTPNYELAAQYAQKGLDGLPWFEFLDGKFRSNDASLDPDSLRIQRSIWAYGSRTILTVNYDDLLDRACPVGYARDVLLDRPVPHLEGRHCVWHLCGYIHALDRSTRIKMTPPRTSPRWGDETHQLSEAEREERVRCARATRLLRDQITGKTLLFIGFDEACTIDAVKWVMKHIAPPMAYLLLAPTNVRVDTSLQDFRAKSRAPLHLIYSADPMGLCVDLSSLSRNDSKEATRRRLDSQAAIDAGTTIGDRYELIKDEKDTSRVSDLWRAIDHEEGKLVWVRLLKPKHRNNVDFIRRFDRGARLTQTLEHPAMLRLLDPCRKDDGHRYHVMEYFHGQPLAAMARSGRMTPESALLVTTMVAGALVQMQERNLVHRDITPHSIFVDRHGAARIADFDLVTRHVPGEYSQHTEFLKAHGDRTAYLAPELRDERRGYDLFDFSTDVYALAATTLFCLTGRDMLDLSVNPARAMEWVEALPCARNVKNALERALRVRKEDRCPTAREFLQMLTGAAEPAGVAEQREPSPVVIEERSSTAAEIQRPLEQREPLPVVVEERSPTAAEIQRPIAPGNNQHRGSSIWKYMLATGVGLSAGVAGGVLGVRELEKGVRPPWASAAQVEDVPDADAARMSPEDVSSKSSTPSESDGGSAVAHDVGSPAPGCLSGVLVDSADHTPFCIQNRLVMGREYTQCVDEGTCPPATCIPGFVYNAEQRCPEKRSVPHAVHCWVINFPDNPVNCMNVERAERYCGTIGGRLPTKQEWLAAWKENVLADPQLDTLELVGQPTDYWMVHVKSESRKADSLELVKVVETKVMSARTRLRCAFEPLL